MIRSRLFECILHTGVTVYSSLLQLESNENLFVITDSRSKEEAATPIVTRAWAIASGPSSAMRGRFFHKRCHPSHKKKETLIGANSRFRLPVSCVHKEVIALVCL